MESSPRKSAIFKFVMVRPPQEVSPENERTHFIRHKGSETPFLDDIRDMRADGQTQAQVIAHARSFVASDDYVFSPAAAGVHPLEAVTKAGRMLSARLTLPAPDLLAKQLERPLGAPLSQFVADDRFHALERSLWQSLWASCLAVDAKPENREEIMQLIGVTTVLKELAAGTIRDATAVRTRLAATPLLPSDLFGGAPPVTPPGGPSPGTGPATQPVPLGDRLLEELLAGHRALDEVRHAYRARRPAYPEAPSPPARDEATRQEWKDGRLTTVVADPGPPRFGLGPEGVACLSASTRELLCSLKLDPAATPVMELVSRLQDYVRHRTSLLFGGRAPSRVRAVGRNLLAARNGAVRPALREDLLRVPGLAALARQPRALIEEGPIDVDPEPVPGGIPGTPTMGITNVLGVGDLLEVQQEILRYEPGEVSHIEDVMQTEKKDRVHRLLERVEETVVTETEITEETQRDLQTTGRFELQEEAQKTIEQEMSLDVGITVSGKFGPVQSEVTSNFATSTSTSESTSSASSYAQEVIDKSLQKIIERVREERTVTTLTETEETNTHTFDNILGSGHVIGIYRWVDKVYKAQIVNYGKRMFLEFHVPRPAAFYLHAQMAEDLEGVTLEKPPEPVGLTPFDVGESNYESWVSKYNVQDVAPPPAPYAVVGTSAEMKYNNGLGEDEPVTTTLKELTLPPGYVAVETFCYATRSFIKEYDEADADKDPTKFDVRVGTQHFDKAVLGDNNQLFNDPEMGAFSGQVPISVWTQNIAAWILNIELLCERTDEAYEQWQLATYQKIMAGYNQAKAEYDNQVAQAQAAAQLQAASVVLTPEAKREIERRELQRGCITLFAGDYYDDYDAMKLESSQGFPEFDLAEAASEGPRAQFFQQAFQWLDMTYLFYPYFWGRKDDWVEVLRLDDPDPVFDGFLKAGYARVVVPVRPAYEDALLYFLESGGVIWNGGKAATLHDPLFVSIVDELKGPVGRPRGEPWDVVVPTTLVILDESSELPDWTLEPEPEPETEGVP